MAAVTVLSVLAFLSVGECYKISSGQLDSPSKENNLLLEKSSILQSAKCRAMCVFELSKLTNSVTSATDSDPPGELLQAYNTLEKFQALMPKILRSRRSLKTPETFSSEMNHCWNNCQNLHSTAIKISDEFVKSTQEENVVETASGVITWPEYIVESAVVYVVLEKYGNLMAKEIVQTTKLQTTIPASNDYEATSFLVLVVGVDGLKCIYTEKSLGPEESITSSDYDTEIVTAIPASYQLPDIDPFELQLTSLQHRDSLVTAEVSWPTVTSNFGQEYHVSWELTDGGLRGTLVTESTSVTLSLLPDTSYQIIVAVAQVNLDSEGEQPETSLSIQSYPLIVDTSIASFSSDQHPSFLTSNDDSKHHSLQDNSVVEEYEQEGEYSNYKFIGKLLGVSFLSALSLVLLFLSIISVWIKLRECCSRRYFDGCTSDSSLLGSQEYCETIYNPTLAIISKTSSYSPGDFPSPFPSQFSKSLCMNKHAKFSDRACSVVCVDCSQQFQ